MLNGIGMKVKFLTDYFASAKAAGTNCEHAMYFMFCFSGGEGEGDIYYLLFHNWRLKSIVFLASKLS